jgi:hypothetical protein
MRALPVIVFVALAVGASPASADSLDVKAIEKKVAACAAEDALKPLGAIEKADTIGSRKADSIVQLTGKKARGYVVFGDEQCVVVPVVGKPLGFAKGNFGAGGVVSYALRGAWCEPLCKTVVSLKSKDDKLLDVLELPGDCTRVTMSKRALFSGRDSIEVQCWRPDGGADPTRADYVIDAGTGSLVTVLDVVAGTAWFQFPEDKPAGQVCQAKPPGGFKVVTVGPKPAVDVTVIATSEEAEAAKVEFQSAGCDQTVATRRYELDKSGKLAPKAGKPKISIAKKLCSCKKL